MNKLFIKIEGGNISVNSKCHFSDEVLNNSSDDRREEDVLLSVAKNLGNTHFMFPRSFASLWMT